MIIFENQRNENPILITDNFGGFLVKPEQTHKLGGTLLQNCK